MRKICLVVSILTIFSNLLYAEWKSIFTQMGNKNKWAGVEVFDEESISITGIIDNMGNSQAVIGYSSDGQSVSILQSPSNPDAQISLFPFISGAGSNGFLAGMSWLKGLPPPLVIDVAKSTNKGKGYTILKDALKVSRDFVPASIYFSDPMTGWILGVSDEGYYLAKTTDGGVSWSEDTSFYAYSTNISLNSVYFINDRIGWIVGGDKGERDEETGDYKRAPSGGILLVSTDGGKTFKKIYENNSFTINAVHFVDCQNGMIAGYDATKAYVLYSSDGGKTFSQGGEIKMTMGSQSVEATYISALQLLNKEDGFLAANYISDPKSDSCLPGVFKTSDGGRNWTFDSSYTDSLSGFSKYACIYGMRFYSERVGYLVGQHMLVAKYTNENGSSEHRRCVECMLGRCHEADIPDAGGDISDVIYPDGDLPDGGLPEITCPSDKILPMMDSTICIDSSVSALNSFNPYVGFAEIVNGNSFIGYLIGEKEGVTLAQGRDTANNRGGEIDYMRLSISPSMKVSEIYGYAGSAFDGANVSAQIAYDENSQILRIKGLRADIVDNSSHKIGSMTIDVVLPVLTARQLSNVSLDLINEICNMNNRPCSVSDGGTDGVIVGEDGSILDGEDVSLRLDAPISDTSTRGVDSGGCGCTTLF